MNLEFWQKVTDIAVKGIAAVALAAGTLWYTAERFNADKSKLCTESIDQTFKMVSENEFSDNYQIMLNHRIRTHEAVCPKLEDRMVKMLNNAWRKPPLPVTPQQPADLATRPGGATLSDSAESDPNKGKVSQIPITAPKPTSSASQWVAYSRRSDDSYAAINFDLVGDQFANPLVKGAVLKARWFVNIRPKNTPISRGDNPVIGTLNGGECVKVLEHAQGQLNEWIRIERVGC